MGHEVSWQLAVGKEEKKKENGMVPIGNTLMKHGTMVDRV